jgi:hypothetical protein
LNFSIEKIEAYAIYSLVYSKKGVKYPRMSIFYNANFIVIMESVRIVQMNMAEMQTWNKIIKFLGITHKGHIPSHGINTGF